MSGNGGDNAHNNAFGGGKNPGMGNTGSGSHSGSSSGGGNTGSHFNGPAVTYGPDGSPRINFSNDGPSQPGGTGGNNGGDRGGNSGSQPGSNNPSAGNGPGGVPTTWDRTANYYGGSDQVSRKALQNMYEEAVRTGNIPAAARGKLRENVQAMLDEDKRQADARAAAEAEQRRQAAEAERQRQAYDAAAKADADGMANAAAAVKAAEDARLAAENALQDARSRQAAIGNVPDTWSRTVSYYGGSNQVSRKALKNMYEKAVSTGSIPGAARGQLRDNVQAMLNEDKRLADARAAAEAEVQRLTIALANAQQAVAAAQKLQADTIAQAAEKARQRQAEEAERQRQAAATEQKRQEDIAAEQARIAAEQEKVRQARQAAADKLKSSGIQSVRGIPTTAAPAAFPLAWSVASGGGISLGSDVASAVWSRISAALAELRGIMTASMVGPVAVTVAGLLYSRDVGVGSDVVPGRDISAIMPGDVFSLPDAATLDGAADGQTGVSMPVRGRMVLRDDGTLETQLVRTSVAGSVPVVRGVLDPATGYWSYALPAMAGVPGQTILVSPSDAPGINGPLGLAGPVPLPEHIVHTGSQDSAPQGVTVTTTPVTDDLDFNDVILIFPADSGLKPLYVMLRNPRNIPGTVSGNGQQAGDSWLGGAGTGDGAPIPSQIADKLRGREFGSFDAFRWAFWKAIAADPELSKQFDPNSLDTMNKGRAPFARKSERIGKRVKVELHHKNEISKGGDVYNVDNLNALTPKRHIEIHKGN